MNRRRKWLGVLSYLVSVGLIAWLLLRVDGIRAIDVIRQARIDYLLLALVLVGSTPCLVVFRWLGVLRAQPQLSISYRTAWRATMVANILNAFLPSKSGDLAKAVYIRKRAGISLGVSTVILERMVDLVVLGLLGVVGYFLSGWPPSLHAGGALMAGVLCAFVAALCLPSIREAPQKSALLHKLTTLVMDMQVLFKAWIRDPGAVMLTFLGSVGVWALSCAAVCVLILALGIDLPLSQAVSTLPIAVLIGLVPISVSGIGPRDAAFVFLLESHITTEEATLIGIGYTLLAYWVIALIALPFVASDLRHLSRYSQSDMYGDR